MGGSPETHSLPRAPHLLREGRGGGSTTQTAGGGQIRGFPKAKGSLVRGKWGPSPQGPGQAGPSPKDQAAQAPALPLQPHRCLSQPLSLAVSHKHATGSP